MTRGVGGQSPATAQTYLKGVSYPATKDERVESTENNGAPTEILELIQRFPAAVPGR